MHEPGFASPLRRSCNGIIKPHLRTGGEAKAVATDMPPIPKDSSPMMEKETLLPQTEEPRPRPAPKRFSRFHGIAFALVLGLFWLTRPWKCSHTHVYHGTASKVPLEIHIMSKCPDARDCIEELIVPTMANVSDKVDFKLSYIGKYVHWNQVAQNLRRTA